MDCPFEPLPSGRLRCPLCDFEAESPVVPPLRRRCPKGSAAMPPPSLPSQAMEAAGSFARWIAAGSPTRDETTVLAIYDEHCAGCENLRGEYPDTHCAKCGCYVSPGGTIVNKIAMATEHCPAGKW